MKRRSGQLESGADFFRSSPRHVDEPAARRAYDAGHHHRRWRGGVDAGHRRIGARRHQPAHRRNVLLQILSEAIVSCVCGAAIGVALAYGGSALIIRFSPMQVAISLTGNVIAFSFSAMIGIFFRILSGEKGCGVDAGGGVAV